MARRSCLALLAILVVGCGPPGPTPAPTPLAHATGERDVLLRMSVGGGLPYPGLTIEQPPGFTLFGDGKIIHIVIRSQADGTTTHELRQGQLSAQAVDDLLRTALNEGGLATAAEFYDNDQIYDAGTTTFTINAAGVLKTVHVYALGFMDATTPSARERAGFILLRDRISSATSAATDLGAFQPEAYRVTLAEPYSGQSANADWPWPDLVPADFVVDHGGGGTRTRLLTPDQAAAVLSLGITVDLVTRAPDGHQYLIRIRALLPDEIPQT